ncbi:glutamate-1-semialdehyde 2,1-aminomutase [Mycolicibacterium madagascariense]|uniref:Glutamate-1-semialdehyde 2,1-aminomutase n=1 Tax=Mycolicibacterium madagascariense TaxID=212765 RepID=A0A7I7X9Q2_9MYCO|nr:aminotransferase class III-fold pyridoxal phosphate-dependent enzyme [Mycolicibacterium madagascariense]MCV7010788.1 aminotransferase class III-fold pyridoxal phosphate-dependent enzyme [Mycolicibacterium madagascariense]BBZ26025.1 glutamate-1-semialdehyde 2,1-aminomutase [Mycolicibacterium madagascariense]
MTSTIITPTHPVSDALLQRAQQVVPNGMYGHQIATGLWPGAPQFVSRTAGSRMWDADGHEYIDLLCSWGPIIHGYQHPKIEEAVERQRRICDTANGPSEHFVALAEKLVDVVEHADWAMFAKNGSDVTTLCLTIARAHTGRGTILVEEGTYHGALPWCNPDKTGVLASDRAGLAYYTYNDLASVEKLVAEHAGDLAGIIVAPFRHDPAGSDLEMVDPAFAQGLRRICDDSGAVLILDEVRTGFRMSFGGSWEQYGVRPDLSSWSKAIGNGYPIAAVLGAERLRESAGSFFVTGTFWFSAVPMVAALTSITLLEEEDGVAHMFARGDQYVAGLREQAASYALPVTITGPVTMPYLSFAGETDHEFTMAWSAECAARGVYVHPKHNGFMSTALTEADVDAVLVATDGAFAEVAKRFF